MTSVQRQRAAPAAQAALLRVDDLAKSYGGVHAVAGVSFDVPRGRITGLIGPNGAGKSTALGMIAGAIKPSQGSVLLNGTNVAGWPSHKIARRGLARTFQQSSDFSGMTVMENLLTAHPDINVVYTINEPAAEGAYAAIKKAGKTKDIVLTSIDGGRLGVQYVKEGKIAATVMQFPKKMAVRGVDYVIDFAKTGKKPSGFIDTGAELITDKPFSDLPSKDTKFGIENCWG